MKSIGIVFITIGLTIVIITGLTTAYCLASSGRKVIVVEDGFIGSGETGRTTARIVTALEDRYFHMEEIFGKENAKLIAESHRAADKETAALRTVFCRKRNIMINHLEEIGITCPSGSKGTFYIWGDISKLSAPLNDSECFFTEALKRKVMTIPGHLFDIHPGHKKNKTSTFNNYIRFSFGPNEKNMLAGLKRLKELIQSAK